MDEVHLAIRTAIGTHRLAMANGWLPGFTCSTIILAMASHQLYNGKDFVIDEFLNFARSSGILSELMHVFFRGLMVN